MIQELPLGGHTQIAKCRALADRQIRLLAQLLPRQLNLLEKLLALSDSTAQEHSGYNRFLFKAPAG